METLQAAVRENSADQQGLLFGRASDAGTEVRSSRPLNTLDAEEMRPALAEDSASVVGYYRIREGNSLVLTPEEIRLAETVFTQPGSVVLLIERRVTGPEANCFFSENGAILNFPLLEFPLDPVALIHRETQRRERASAKADDVETSLSASDTDSVAPAAEEETAPRRRKRGWLVLACVLVLVAALSTGLFLNRSRIASPPPVSSRSQAGSPLRAERQGEDLKILWDLSSAAVANATSGVLDIQDGITPRQIVMTADQVRFGSVLYSPVSDQVSVRLTTLNNNRPTAQASVLVLLKRPGVAPSSVPPSSAPPSLPRVAVPANNAAAPPAARIPSPRSTSTSPPPGQPVEPKPESHSATRPFVPPPGQKPVSHQFEPENVPSLGSTAQAVPVIELPFGSVLPPPAPTSAPRGPARPVESPRPPASASPAPASPAPAVTAPARNEPAKAPKDDFIAPVLLSQGGVRTPPELPPILKPLAIRVRVGVNPAGKVTRAQAIPENGVHALLLQAAVDAAWKCSFQPARQRGTPVASSVTIVFHLGPEK